jgi:hypothetical protein
MDMKNLKGQKLTRTPADEFSTLARPPAASNKTAGRIPGGWFGRMLLDRPQPT